jgi:hypothetical protein
MYEKKFKAIPPQEFIADGNTLGAVHVAHASIFKVKMLVRLSAPSLPDLDLEIKRIETNGTIYVGRTGKSIDDRVDTSLYTVAAGAYIWWPEDQRRSTIIADDHERAVYEEEPVVAKRVIGVDRFGRTINWAQDGVVPSEWDDVEFTRDLEGDIIQADFYFMGDLITTLVLTYDSTVGCKNLMSVRKSYVRPE